MQSISDNVPLKSLLYFIIFSFAGTSFFIISLFPSLWPICFPLSLAVSIPSRVLWWRSSTSFSDCSKAWIICSQLKGQGLLLDYKNPSETPINTVDARWTQSKTKMKAANPHKIKEENTLSTDCLQLLVFTLIMRTSKRTFVLFLIVNHNPYCYNNIAW